MTEANREKIIDRVRKLLALAGNNTNEAERDAAMAKAQRLLIEHKISESEMASADSEVNISDWVITGRNGQWARRIARSIGKLYFCGYVYTSFGKKVQHHFIGRQHDALVAQEITKFVVESVYREGARQMRARGANTSYWTSFVNSASLYIMKRVATMIADSQQASAERSSSQALVVAGMYQQAQDAAQAFIQGIPDLKTAVARPLNNPSTDGWRAGADYGSTIPITKQVGSGPKKLK